MTMHGGLCQAMMEAHEAYEMEEARLRAEILEEELYDAEYEAYSREMEQEELEDEVLYSYYEEEVE